MNIENDLERRLEEFRTRISQTASWRKIPENENTTTKSVRKDNHQKPRTLATAPWLFAGWLSILVCIGGGTLWAANSRIDAAAIALGTVSVETHRKTIAHLDGGVVSEILVQEGELVQKDQPLVRLDATHANATFDLLIGRERSLLARLARMRAEKDGSATIEFPNSLLDLGNDPIVLDLMESEMQVHATRKDSLMRKDNILAEQISKQRSEINGLIRRRDALEKRQALLIEELEMMSGLVRDGLVARNRVLAIDRRVAEAEADLHDLDARLSTAKNEIEKISLERVLLRETQLGEIARETQLTREKLAEVREQIRAAENVQDRTIIRAPERGVVVAMLVHTTGGVLKPGETVMEIVPDNDNYVFDLRIDPNDIDIVYNGQQARIRLNAYNARTTPQIAGTLVHVSADRLTDPDTGAHYFAGRVVPDPSTDENSPALTPGMHAEVYLVTAERTVLDFVLDPVIRSTERAAKEL